MIFVILGTQDKPFTRLLELIDKNINEKIIDEQVIVQAGYTKYKSKNMVIFDLLSQNEFNSYIKNSRLIITHGGVGSILAALKENKPIIAVPRLSKYGEHIDDHQLEIIKLFSRSGYLLPLYNFDLFKNIFCSVNDFIPKLYESNQLNFLSQLENLIFNNKWNSLYSNFKPKTGITK